ncbi:hypothetical protein HDZ31DRAFT_32940 [Schizophyllum fasciatum]
MSVDPPQRMHQPRAISRDVSMQYMPFVPQQDYSMDTIEESSRRSPSFRGSLPPTASFRMRMSATPQVEPTREASMPPSLSALQSNPTFVRAPSQGIDSRQRLTTGATLGTVAEAQRHLFSPTKSRSTLSFTVAQESAPRAASAEAAQKALYELDAYKTPILPSRRRKDTSDASALASSSRPTTGPDLFKKKRKFVPMTEEEQLALNMTGQSKKKKKGKDKEAKTLNGTKPYASQGGMKKLLARHKTGGDPDASFESEGGGGLNRSDSQMDTSAGTTEKENKTEHPKVPDLPPQETFAPRAADAPAQGSSLRIGRTKTSRNHLARPTVRPLKKKFSAAFDDDDADDEAMEERNQEIEKLNEIQAKAPPFKVNADFFAKPPQAAPVQPDATGVKEPPVTSLPFSLGSQAPPVSKARDAAKDNAPAAPADKPVPAAFSFAAPAKAEPTPTPATNGASTSTSSSGVPNFFSSSPALAKPLTLPTPSTPLFSSPASTPKPDSVPLASETPKPAAPPVFSFGTPAPDKPVNDPSSPFWVGSKAPAGTPASNSAPSGSLFGAPKTDEPAKAATPAPAFSFEKKEDAPKPAAPAPAPFSFGKPAEPPQPSKPAESTNALFGQTSSSSTAAGSLFGAPAAQPAPPAAFSFGAPASAPKPEEAPKPAPFSFGAPAAAVEATKPATPFSFGQPAAASGNAPKPLFGAAASTAEPPKPPFGAAPSVQAPKPLFGAAPAAEAPKPLFGSAPSSPAPFSFGQPAAKPDASTPFSFGAAPSTPPAAPDTKKPAFSFGAPAAAPAAPAPFSFGSSTAAPATTEAPKPFSFGAPAPARPSTPPKNDDNEMRMEESPTREITKAEPSKLILNTSGTAFSFGGSNSGFGSASSSAAPSNPFAFGVASTPASKPEEKPAFGFGQPAQTGFSFGQSKPAETTEPQRPATTGSFGFGASTPTSTTSPFAFGTPSSSNPFGQASSQTGSAPNSPSTFNQPAPFSFGAPPVQQSNSFSFGSQPASPSVAPLTLPQPGTPSGGFGTSGTFGVASPTSPFTSAPTSAATDGGGGGLFTMGSASSNAPPAAGPGGRPVRRLPQRRKH